MFTTSVVDPARATVRENLHWADWIKSSRWYINRAAAPAAAALHAPPIPKTKRYSHYFPNNRPLWKRNGSVDVLAPAVLLILRPWQQIHYFPAHDYNPQYGRHTWYVSYSRYRYQVILYSGIAYKLVNCDPRYHAKIHGNHRDTWKISVANTSLWWQFGKTQILAKSLKLHEHVNILAMHLKNRARNYSLMVFGGSGDFNILNLICLVGAFSCFFYGFRRFHSVRVYPTKQNSNTLVLIFSR